MSEKIYIKVAWGGFCDGKLDWLEMDDRFGSCSHILMRPALFSTRKEARKQYEDVRKVEMVYQEKIRDV